MWKDKRPEAAARLDVARPRIGALAERLEMPAENLLQPDAMRRACWEHRGGGEDEIRALLASRDARQWQIDLTAPLLAEAFADAEASAVDEAPANPS
ncbi:hypothetical protein [Demequina litorisediminis]|uniref:hypothetical protein n=1 Tax=Demequina litorisediminis TaxID=1849022 RepID=UPI0032AFC472